MRSHLVQYEMVKQFFPIPNHLKEELSLLASSQQQILQKQTINPKSPGTILQDFQTVVQFLQPEGIEVSSNYHHFSLKYLPLLNSRLSHPIETNLKRPQQKSYPYIHGLYFLLRTSGLSQFVAQGRKKLVLDNKLLDIWQGLNPTEQYFSLLESWLIWGDSEILGESRSPVNDLYRCLLFWQEVPDGGLTLNSYSEQDKLVYHTGTHNLALLHLFGLIEITLGEAEPCKGWRMNSVKRCPWGDAMMALLRKFYTEHETDSEEEINIDFRIAFDKFKPYLQSYFPDWQQIFMISTGNFAEAIYIFKVSLLDAWRRIAIPSNISLDEVAVVVVNAFKFDDEHLYRFNYQDRLGRSFQFHHPFVDIPPNTSDFRLGDFSLEVGNHLELIFDLSQEWEFDLHLEKIEPVGEGKKQPQILNYHGKPPSQYDDEDEWTIISF